MACEVAVRWTVSEEDSVQLIIKDETFEEATVKARAFLAAIREERLIYNQQVMQPLLDKRDELEQALIDKQRQMAALDTALAARTAAGATVGDGWDTNGLHP